SLVPAVMHGPSSTMVGIPYESLMWFVEEAGVGNGSEIRVVQLSNALQPNASEFTWTDIAVAPYVQPPAAAEPGGEQIGTGDTRILDVEWRNNYLVAAHNVGISGDSDAHVQWFEFQAVRKACGCPGTTVMLVQE